MAIAVSLPLLIGTTSPAFADSPDDPPPVTIDGVPVEEGSDATVVVGADEVAEARETATEDPDGLTAEEQDFRDSLVEDAADEGGSLTAEDVDVVPLLDGDVLLAAPTTVEITEVTVDINDEQVDLSARADEVAEATAEAGGPGMASPYWRNDGDGAYKLKVTGLGDALFTYERNKLINDGSGAYTWYSYSRKGDAQPYKRNNAPDARVSKLRIQSYPYDKIEKGLLNWNEWKPASDFTGNCDAREYNASISVFGVGVGTTFRDCDKYSMWRNADNPGSYWLEMDQGLKINSGNREIGYTVAWKAKQGTAGSQHDFQRVRFYLSGNSSSCSDYDSSKTCSP